MIYRLIEINNGFGQITQYIIQDNGNQQYTSFAINPNISNYQQFKKDLQSGATLQDADGNNMTADQITTFLGSLK